MYGKKRYTNTGESLKRLESIVRDEGEAVVRGPSAATKPPVTLKEG